MCITLVLLTSKIVYSVELDNKLIGKVIILDAGHGGVDAGTSVNGIKEKDINLSIVLKLKKELIKQGVDVLLVRDGDYDLSEPNAKRRKKSDFDNRINLINNSKADLYLSIHINYLNDGKYYGAQTFYTEENIKLANIIQKEFIDNLKSPMKEKKLSNDIYMYKQLEIPGVLIECGFLSNKNERYLLQSNDYQSKIVSAIVEALIKYY